MVGFTLRELECTQCGGTFTDMEGDLWVPVPRLCDDCLKDLWQLSDEELDSRQVDAEIRRLLNSLREQQSLEDILSQRRLIRGG